MHAAFQTGLIRDDARAKTALTFSETFDEPLSHDLISIRAHKIASAPKEKE